MNLRVIRPILKVTKLAGNKKLIRQAKKDRATGHALQCGFHFDIDKEKHNA